VNFLNRFYISSTIKLIGAISKFGQNRNQRIFKSLHQTITLAKKTYFCPLSSTLNIYDILTKVKIIYKEDQLTLLEKIVALIKKKDAQSTPTKLSKISGIGSKVWKQKNIDEYIDKERQSLQPPN